MNVSDVKTKKNVFPLEGQIVNCTHVTKNPISNMK